MQGIASIPIDEQNSSISHISSIEYFERIKNSSAINGKDSRECEKLALALRYLWEIK